MSQQDIPTPAPEPSSPSPPSHHYGNAFLFIWGNPWVRAISYLLLIAFALYLLIVLSDGYLFALQVGIIGFVIAYVLNPLVKQLQRLRFSRTFAVVVIYLGLLQLLILGSLLVAQVVSELGEFINLIPKAIETLEPIIQRLMNFFAALQERLPGFLNRGTDTAADAALPQTETNPLLLQLESTLTRLIETITQGVVNAGESLLERTPSFFVSGVTNVISVGLQVFLALLASAYFLHDYPKFVASFYRHIPNRYRGLSQDLSRKADQAMGGYLRGQLLITSILGLLVWLGLSIIGVPLALAISFLAAIFNLVPYLGPIIGVVPAVLLGLTVSPLTAFLAVIIFIIANQLEGNVLAPMILSRSTDLHPVTVLLVILAGAGMFGLLGALLAVPVVAFIKVLIEEYVLSRPAFTQLVPTEVTTLPADNNAPPKPNT